MAVNGTIAQTNWTDKAAIQGTTAVKIKAVHITELRTAVNALEGYAANVVNCGCESCQDSCTQCTDKECKCQSCQNTCTCQSDKQCKQCSCQNTCTQCTDKCQSCQSCQDSCTCQSNKCQKCNGCQNTCTECTQCTDKQCRCQW